MRHKAQELQLAQEEAAAIDTEAQHIVDKQKQTQKKKGGQAQQSTPPPAPPLDLAAALGKILESAMSRVIDRLEKIESREKSTPQAGMGGSMFERGTYPGVFPAGMYPTTNADLGSLGLSDPSFQVGQQQGGGATSQGQATTSHSQASGVPLGGVNLLSSHPDSRSQESLGT